MKKPMKWLTLAAAGCVFMASVSTIPYKVLADDFLYTDANVSITSIVDKYIEDNGEVFTAPETTVAPKTTQVAQPVNTQTDAQADEQESTTEAMLMGYGKITELPSETVEEPTTEQPLVEDVQEVAEQTEETSNVGDDFVSPVMDFTGKAVVTATGSVNIRTAGDVSADKIGTIDGGGLMNVVEQGDTWSHITSGNVDGYIKNEFIAFGSDAADYASANLVKVAVVNTAALKLREQPTMDSQDITLLAQGESYAISEIGSAWTKIQVDTIEGYVKNEYIMISYHMPTAQVVEVVPQETETSNEQTTEETTTEAPATEVAPETTEATAETEVTTEKETSSAADISTNASSIGQAIASYACQFVGNPYVWGGTSLTNGADCSGFVQTVFKDFGYSIPRTCTPQSNSGTPISMAELQAGDLVFYDHGTGSCEHVAIYIGNGQVVHASGRATGIKISNVNYSTPFKACRIAN